MVTLCKIREILGPDCSLSDAELELLRDQLVALADIALEVYRDQHRTGGSTTPDSVRCADRQEGKPTK